MRFSNASPLFATLFLWAVSRGASRTLATADEKLDSRSSNGCWDRVIAHAERCVVTLLDSIVPARLAKT
jgi:hypothetical protein